MRCRIGNSPSPAALICFLFLGLSVFGVNRAFARVYVDASVAVSGDGSSWAKAKKTVVEGIEAVSADRVVYVAEGTYYTSISMPSKIAIYGGFARTEKNAAARDLNRHHTIIDASRMYAGTPAMHVVTFDSVTSARLDGFILTGATITDESIGGAGVFFYKADASNILTNCTVAGNKGVSGTGIRFLYSSASVLNSRICGNWTPVDIIDTGMSTASLVNCLVAGNVTRDAISVVGNNLDIINCAIIGSSVAVTTYWGSTSVRLVNTILADCRFGFHAYDGSSAPRIANCLFRSDELDYMGAGGNLMAADLNAHVPGASGNIDGDPRFDMATTRPCTAVYDPGTSRTTITDSSANYVPGTLVGSFARILTTYNNHYDHLIGANDAHTFSIAGDYSWAAGYFLVNYQLKANSPCIDTGTSVSAPYDDLNRKLRPVDFPGKGSDIAKDAFDIGPFEFGTYNACGDWAKFR